MRQIGPSVIRTIVPMIVGALLVWLGEVTVTGGTLTVGA